MSIVEEKVSIAKIPLPITRVQPDLGQRKVGWGQYAQRDFGGKGR